MSTYEIYAFTDSTTSMGFTKRSWSRLHVDNAGPVNGNMLFIIV